MNVPSSSDYIEYLLDQLQLIGPVVSKPMFGSHGFFLDGLMFAIVIDDVLYLKVDDQSQKEFVALGLAPFRYPRGEKQISLGYYQAPDEVIDDGDALREWANRAFLAALQKRSIR